MWQCFTAIIFTSWILPLYIVRSFPVFDQLSRYLKENKNKKSKSKDKYQNIGRATEIPPKVFILGAQKGGSSSMMWMLITHPQLCEGVRKETHFFGLTYNGKEDSGILSNELKNEYFSLFRDPVCVDSDDTSFIDGTPVLHHPEVAGNMNAFYENLSLKDSLRMIVMLREPVSRDFSWYQHKTRAYLTGHVTGLGFNDSRKGNINYLKTFKETWEKDLKEVRKGKLLRSDIPNDLAGDYLLQLEEFMKYFRRNQILILNSDLAFIRTSYTMEIIRQFLDIQKFPDWETMPFPHDDHLGTTFHSSDPECVFKHIPKLDCDFRDLLAKHYAESNKALEKWMKLTKADAPLSEPDFIAFGDSYRNISCVENARDELNSVIQAEGRVTC